MKMASRRRVRQTRKSERQVPEYRGGLSSSTSHSGEMISFLIMIVLTSAGKARRWCRAPCPLAVMLRVILVDLIASILVVPMAATDCRVGHPEAVGLSVVRVILPGQREHPESGRSGIARGGVQMQAYKLLCD
jgi:hypothetical protein